MERIDLNCDLGESYGAYTIGNDDEVLKHVTSVNIACGFHAGDPQVMETTVKNALENNVAIGAHPGFPDLAGFVRSKIWDVLHNFEERTSLPDVDVIYYDATNINKEREKDLEKQLIAVHPFIPWSVKNQARMHFANGVAPYASSKDAISKFPETATALGVKLDENDNLLLTAPYGIQDVVNLKGKPTPYFQQCTKRMKIYQDRIQHKQWHLIWYRIQYE